MGEATGRVISFVDGQNLFYAAKQAFGYSYPNFDPERLTEAVATVREQIAEARRIDRLIEANPRELGYGE